MQVTSFAIRTDTPIGTISPRLYGHFAEHLGRCCYDGLWVGPNRPEIPQQNGFRQDVLEALKAMPVPMMRWPGGCYADHYHWRDGVGPVDQRPIRLGMSCGLQVEDDNSIGTHEFLWFCEQIGAEPYLAGNVGSGSVQELCDWLEYCNTAVPTTLAKLRATNGSPKPFGVKIWGVGNESWGCGGHYEAAVYGREFLRYATMLRQIDPSAELVICGFEDEWNITLIETVKARLEMVDHISIHRYWINGGPEVNFSEEEYYQLIAEAAATEDFVLSTKAILEKGTEGKRKIGIALDEWGVWHPEARNWGPQGEPLHREPTTYEQANTMRDAIATAIALEGFHRQCDSLSMANLAQIVNVLHAPVMTDGPQIWLTPTYHVLRMHKAHLGATALPVSLDSALKLPDGSSAVSGTASLSSDETLTITLINRHYSEASEVQIAVPAGYAAVASELLSADDPRAQNSIAEPNRVVPSALDLTQGEADTVVRLPQHSIASITLQKAG